MTKNEISLLLYLETRAVDFSGRVDSKQINDDDRAIIDRWKSEGFIDHGRIVVDDHNRDGITWVKLSGRAHVEAASLRRERAERMWANKKYTTVAEKKAIAESE